MEGNATALCDDLSNVKLVIAKKPGIFGKIYYAALIRHSSNSFGHPITVVVKGEPSTFMDQTDGERKAVLQLAEDMKIEVGKLIAKAEGTEAEVSKTVTEVSKRMTHAQMTAQIVNKIKANPFEKK